jgi:hypothetical protein
MKKISKYLLLLAAAVFTFTACEKNVEREPSPLDIPGAIAFTNAGETVELDMTKEPLETSFTVFRTSNLDKADTIKLVVEADPVFEINPVVIFAPGDKQVTTKVTFPEGEVFGNYSFKLTMPEDHVSPYLQGTTTFAYNVSIVAWSDIKKGVWVDDAGLCSTFGLPAGAAWIIDYQSSILPKNAGTRIRVINAYKTIATAEDPETGLPNGYPYAEEFSINKGDYNFSLDLLANGTALFADDAFLGLSYSGYGDMIIVNMKAASAGAYDKEAGKATFDAATKFYAFGFYDATAADPYNLYQYAGFRFYESKEAWLADQKEPVVVDADVTTYEGSWTIKGLDINEEEDVPVSANVTVTSYVSETSGQFYAIQGLYPNMPVCYGTFDEETHKFKIERSQGDPVEIEGVTYIPVLYMVDANWGISGNITLDIVPGEGGTLVTDEESAAVGFIIVYINPADQSQRIYGEGMFDISFEPANAGAPARKAAARTSRLMRPINGMNSNLQLVR